MKRIKTALIILTILLTLCSCASTNAEPERFSLSDTSRKKSEIGMLVGNVTYGAGFFFPSDSDILDISLLKTDSVTGLVSEISHQRIRNLLKFPVQFTLRYDKADLSEGESCTLIVSLLVNDTIKAQGISLLQRDDSGLGEASVVLVPV
jgi:uncharacterized lipoprotein YbaY